MKLVEPPRPDPAELRQRLRAHARVELARRAWLAADKAQKAADMLAEARDAAAHLAVLDSDVGRHFAEQIKSGADFSLLPDLAAKSASRAMADRRVVDLGLAHDQLVREAAEAHAALAAASTAADLAIAAILGAEGEKIADELEAAEATARTCRERVAGIGMSMHLRDENGRPSLLPLSARLKRVITGSGLQQRPDPKWREFADRLRPISKRRSIRPRVPTRRRPSSRQSETCLPPSRNATVRAPVSARRAGPS